ncbi:hypothetical protein [Scopulibacillus cellulosilyticus]|uniref:ABC-2 type transport system permease protein n=1 Tax=Scopulibacillus cellulosilyticus TaxID=2665665 RepID=A0ABW2Q0Q0_9BACL
MSSSNVFWTLFKYEYKAVFANRKLGRKNKMPQKVWLVYAALLYIAFLGFAVYATYHHWNFQLRNIWFFTLGLPWMLFGFGISSIKNEWENSTEGWWLTLPYSRIMLIGAKYIAALFKTLFILIVIYALAIVYAILYGACISVWQGGYPLHEVTQFIMSGFWWYLFLIGLMPLMVSIGVLVGVIKYSTAKYISPLIYIFMFILGYGMYGGLGLFNQKHNLYTVFSGEISPGSSPFPVVFIYFMIAGWVLAYLMVRFSGYLLKNRLDL